MTLPREQGTLAVGVEGDFVWPYRVERIIVALDGQRLPIDVAHRSTQVRVEPGEHKLTLHAAMAYPCNPGSRDTARMRTEFAIETSDAPAAAIMRLQPRSMFGEHPFDVVLAEEGTITYEERLAMMRAHPRLAAPLEESMLICERRNLACRIESAMDEARRNPLQIDRAHCLALLLDELEGREIDEDVYWAYRNRADGCGQSGCGWGPAVRVVLPDCGLPPDVASPNDDFEVNLPPPLPPP